MREKILKDLKYISRKDKADIYARFFKTGKGEYGEGDLFVGIKMPDNRKICKKYFKEISFEDIKYFLTHEIHEYRIFALVSMTYIYEKADENTRKKIYDLYLANTKHINNWDLVDLSAHKIVGKYVLDRNRDILYTLANSKNMWEQRISIIATAMLINNNEFEDTLKISKILLNHEHDLIHKAVGWMLREVGKRDMEVEEDFLKKHYKNMPRTMLRYAIERFPEKKRLAYLHGEI